MKVSVIIPVYNVSAYIEKCVWSVMEQTYTDVECILVDDCTPDDSIEKCKTLIDEYVGNIEFKILHHEKNRGLSASRNTGTLAATGEYVYYLDSDDYITPACLKLMVNQVIKHPGVELVQGTTESVPYKEFYSLKHLQGREYIEEKYWLRKFFYALGVPFPVNAWNKLLNRNFIISNKLFFKEGLIHEDELWMYWITRYVQKIAFVYHTTYIHLIRKNSIMTTSSKEREAHHWGIILTEIMTDSDSPEFRYPLLRTLLSFVGYYAHGVDKKCYESLYIAYLDCLQKHKLPVLRKTLKLYHDSRSKLIRKVWRRIIYWFVKQSYQVKYKR